MIRPERESRKFETENGTETLPLYDILYAESDCGEGNNPCRLHLADRVVVCRDHFEAIFPLLGKYFLFCMKRGAVNQQHIRSFAGNVLALDTGERIEIDPFLAAKFREAYCRNLVQWVWED